MDQHLQVSAEKKGRFGFDTRRHLLLLGLLVTFSIFLLMILVPDDQIKAAASNHRRLFGFIAPDPKTVQLRQWGSATLQQQQHHAEQMEWIENEFRAADPNEQEWCKHALIEGTPLQPKSGAQFSQDVFLARNLFFERYVRPSKKGFYIEAGANHYKRLSSTYFYDKCLGWEGLCVEPQKQYQKDLQKFRTCSLVPMCLTKERTDKMMIGGKPPNKGDRMFIRPLPDNGQLPSEGINVWNQISCAPLADVLNQYGHEGNTHHVDLFVLDVEGAELPVLDTIDWGRITFTVLQIETDKMRGHVQERLKLEMAQRGYELAYKLHSDSIFVQKGDIDANILPAREILWEPPNGMLGLKE